MPSAAAESGRRGSSSSAAGHDRRRDSTSPARRSLDLPSSASGRDSPVPGSPLSVETTALEVTAKLKDTAYEQTQRIWQLPIDSVSIGPDVVRLSREICVGRRNGPYLFVGSAQKPAAECLREFVLVLNEIVEPNSPHTQHLQEALTSLLKYKDDDHELVERFRSCFGASFLPLSGHIVSLLRCLTLDIIGPAVNLLRSTIYEKYPYGGVNGGNRVTIEVEEDDVFITHTRREKSRGDAPEERFFFTWNVQFCYNLSSRLLDTCVNVVAVEFDEGVRTPMRRQIRSMLEPFIGERNAYNVLWSRHLLRLPVHKDIARLSKSIVIFDADNKEVFREKDDEEVPGHISFRNIISILAKLLNDTVLQEAIATKFDQYIKTSGDLSEQILNFFGSGAFSEESPVVKVLKLVNQEMIYPAVTRLRNQLYEQFPYKDVKGGWLVHIHLTPGAVSVTHLKKEQSHDSRDEARFEFEWLLKLLFDHRMETFKPLLYISNYTFNDRILSETKRVVLDTMLPFIHPDSMYLNIWLKPLEHNPVHRDLIRFLRGGGFEIVGADGHDLYRHSGAKDVSDIQSLKSVLLCLANNLDSSIVPAIEEKFSSFIIGGADLSEELKRLLLSGVIPENSRTMRLIKCLHSDMIFPGYLKLRNAFYEQFPFRDVKNSWHIQIKFGKTATVAISKRERTHSEKPDEYFEFRWVLLLTFNSDLTNFTSDLRITDYSWTERTKDEIKARLRPLWAPFIVQQSVLTTSPGMLRRSQAITSTPKQFTTYMTAADLLQIVQATLTRQPGKLHAEHDDLPSSTDIRLLLSQLALTLNTVPNLPLVAIKLTQEEEK